MDKYLREFWNGVIAGMSIGFALGVGIGFALDIGVAILSVIYGG